MLQNPDGSNPDGNEALRQQEHAND